MISLKRSIDENGIRARIERRERALGDAWRLVGDALEALSSHTLQACPPVAEDYIPILKKLGERIATSGAETEPGAIEPALLECLRGFGEEAGEDYRAKSQEIREVVLLMAETAESFASQFSGGSEEMSRFAGEIEDLSHLDNLTELRRRLRTEVRTMRTAIERRSKEEAEALESMRKELRTLRGRLEQAENSAALDPLTLLANRRGLERHYATRVSSGANLCVALMDLQRFEAFNERYGQAAGDALLRTFGLRLRSAMRPSEAAGRWKSDQFVVMLEGSLQDALLRARQLHAKACGPCSLMVADVVLAADIRAALGVAEASPNESCESLVGRAHIMLQHTRGTA